MAAAAGAALAVLAFAAGGAPSAQRLRGPRGIHSWFIRCPHFVHRTGALSAYHAFARRFMHTLSTGTGYNSGIAHTAAREPW
jgi:hypothetical protein